MLLGLTWWAFCSGALRLDSVLMFGIPYTVIVLGASQLDAYHPVRIPPLLGTIGDATYSIYLTHFAVLTAMLNVIKRIHLPIWTSYQLLLTVMFAITVVIGCVVHGTVERPLLDVLRRRRIRLAGEIPLGAHV